MCRVPLSRPSHRRPQRCANPPSRPPPGRPTDNGTATPEPRLLSGVYGLVLASALAAALDSPDEQTTPGSDALWVLLTALAAAAAHGYAHVLSHRMTAEPGD